MRSKTLSLVFLLVVIFQSAGLAADKDPVIAKAGNFVLRMSDLEKIINSNPPDKQKVLRENPQQRVAAVKKLIDIKIVSDAARAENFDKRPEIREQTELLVNNYLANEYLNSVVIGTVTFNDEDIASYYSQNREKYKGKPLEEVRESVREQLRNELARKKVVDYIKKTYKETGAEIYSDIITGASAPKGPSAE